MKQVFIFGLLILSLSVGADDVLGEQSDANEEILGQELSTIEEGQQQFDHLVESTMDVMGPELELAQTIEQ